MDSKRIDVKNYPFSVTYQDFGDEGKCYTATFFDYPRIVGSGKTPDEAIEDARDLLQETIEYLEAAGETVIVPVAKLFSDELSGRLTFRCSKRLHEDIIEHSNKEGISINSFINDAVHYYIRALEGYRMEEELRAAESSQGNLIKKYI